LSDGDPRAEARLEAADGEARIRRVLSDGALPPTTRRETRLRQVPPAAADGPGAALDPVLRSRLEALGVAFRAPPVRSPTMHGPPPGALPRGPARDAEPLGRPAEALGAPPWPAPGDPGAAGTGIADLVGAVERETPFGTFLQVDRRIPLASRHGRVQLETALERRVPLRVRERGPTGADVLEAADATFIDTETSGLAGGTGTVAFLVGAGWVEDDGFRVRQYFMRDYPEEAALLHALELDLGERPLVSFNGRSFDWPLLTTRWRMNRRHPVGRAHLDLLPAARRLWGCTLHSHSLATIERYVLRLERGEDLSGWLIPPAWFEFLRSGHAATLAQAFRHNEIDVVSMLALFGEVGRILADPAAGVAAPGDRLGTARLLLDLEDTEAARACLEADLDGAEETDARPRRRLLGHLCRRAGEWDAARVHFEVVAQSAVFDCEAYEQVAKILEHRERDFPGALVWTERALARTPPDSRRHGAFLHRKERLLRRIERALAPPDR
jgi:hypothetical protein